MRRRDRRDQSAKDNVLAMALEGSDAIWLVLKFVVRIPVLLLRLLI